MGWIDEIKVSWTVTDAARLVGLEVRDGSTPQIRPCPACGESRRGSSDRRPPVNVHQGNTAWTCKRGACGQGGDVVDLVALAMFNRRCADCTDDERRELRERFGVDGTSSSPTPRRRAPAPKPLAPKYPPADEVAALWNVCGPLTDDAEARAWFPYRWPNTGAETLQRATEADFMRVLPPDADGPAWARLWDKPSGTWGRLGYRLITPWFDSTGAVRSLRGRWIRTTPPKSGPKKAAAPTGMGIAGLVLANHTARAMLQAGKLPPGREVWIWEGEPDWLAHVTRFDLNNDDAPAVLGIAGEGSWTKNNTELPARIPDGAVVAVATDTGDPDGKGDKYADAIIQSLAGRAVDIKRYRGRKQND